MRRSTATSVSMALYRRAWRRSQASLWSDRILLRPCTRFREAGRISALSPAAAVTRFCCAGGIPSPPPPPRPPPLMALVPPPPPPSGSDGYPLRARGHGRRQRGQSKVAGVTPASEAMCARNTRHGGGVAGECYGLRVADLATGDDVAEGGGVGAVLRAGHGSRGSPESVGVHGGGAESGRSEG